MDTRGRGDGVLPSGSPTPPVAEPRAHDLPAAAQIALPSITLPKGGGAIRGVDEKLTVGSATGSANLSVPVFTSPGRSGFGPSLSLSYDSGGAHGVFGLGWRLAVPSITRKTSRGLPRYDDRSDSDVFVLSESEDLVPLRLQRADKSWQDDSADDASHTYTVRRYRPRSESDFARIERWQHKASGDVHWRTISRDNVTNVLGLSDASRIFDPDHPTHVWSWLLDISYDARGNAIVYDYKPEDPIGVPLEPGERGRSVGANRYLKRIRYANTTPYAPDPLADEAKLPAVWHFEVVFDYGEHDLANPAPAELTPWSCRPDPFSSYRSGFELRTYRRCRRVLMFHHVSATPDAPPAIVRSTDLGYENGAADPTQPVYSQLTSVTQTGYRRLANTAGYDTAQLPALELRYSPLTVNDVVSVAPPDTLDNLPAGVDGRKVRWTDLDGEGSQGVLIDDDAAWYYRRNISALATAGVPPTPRFEPMELVATKPESSGRDTQLVDLHADGHLCAVTFAPPLSGYYERDDSGGWTPFRTLASTANIDWTDPNLRTVDLDGDGLADVLLTADDAFTWYPWLETDGVGPARRVLTTRDETRGPAAVFADGEASIYLADMSGDGLSDLVRVRNGEVCYWPNIGYGRFGAQVVMSAAPWFDQPDLFDERRVRLVDIDGSGTADLVYLGSETVTIWFNQCGTSWTEPTMLASFPEFDDVSTVAAMDLLGRGTSCLVWSSPLPSASGRQLRYLDLMNGTKPHLLTGVANNIGAETTLEYTTSTQSYLEDRYSGHPWVTRLAFPVHVVSRMHVVDHISRTTSVSTYRYHHGYFDSVEREFRGFAMVEQLDAESLPAATGTGTFTSTPTVSNAEFTLPPVRTKTWFHTGAYVGGQDIAAVLATEYYQGDAEAAHLAPTQFVDAEAPEEMREACRALRGRVLRTEVYADDGTKESTEPYSTTEHRYRVLTLQPPTGSSYGSSYACDLESLAYHYERDPNDPRCAHELTLEVDDLGNVTKSASVAYPRRAKQFEEQGATLVTYTEHDVVNIVDQPAWYRVGVPIESATFELTGPGLETPAAPFDPDSLLAFATASTTAEIPFEQTPDLAKAQKRRFANTRTLYRTDDLTAVLPRGVVEPLALVDRTYTLTATTGLVAAVYAEVSDAASVTAMATAATGGYVDLDANGAWWSASPRVFYSPDPAHGDAGYARLHFYLPQGQVDPFGGVTSITWENDLVVTATIDAVGNTTSAVVNYRVLQPWLVTDPNENRTGLRYDSLGMVVASAQMGKKQGAGDEGDHLDLSSDEARPGDDPTTTFQYDLGAYQAWVATSPPDPDRPSPVWAQTRTRVNHRDAGTHWIESFVYTDGLGRVALTKNQAEPGDAPVRDANGKLVLDGGGKLTFASTTNRWVGSGRVVYDNKGNPVKAYEPFFDSSSAYDDESELVEWGVTAITRYDPLGRAVRVDKPDGTYTSVAFDPWRQLRSDENDNVTDSAWYARASAGTADEQDAAAKTSKHAGTPGVSDLDPLGRVFHTVADNGTDGTYETTLLLDIAGHVLETTDALGRSALTTTYDLAGHTLRTESIDAGIRWHVVDPNGKPLRDWARIDEQTVRQIDHRYDAGRRPTELHVKDGAAPARIAESIVYGESLGLAASVLANLRGVPHLEYGGAGVKTTAERDFKGNVCEANQRLLDHVGIDVDWTNANTLEDATLLTTKTTYDALNRVVTVTTNDQSVTRPVFNERSLLAAVTVNLRGDANQTKFVSSASYDPKGQRTTIEYGNGVTTTYTYDEQTFRLVNLLSVRADKKALQNITYTYDPVGNITRITDPAQRTIVYDNAVIPPAADYTYDAVYRLEVAVGREHIGQTNLTGTRWEDAIARTTPLSTDMQAMRNYTETYAYDSVGNIKIMDHHAGAAGTWSRAYDYDEPNLTPGNNRLTSTHVASVDEPYTYDVRGNMTAMPHLQSLEWDFKDQLRTTAKRVAHGNDPETTHYGYDLTGQRIRKTTIDANGARTHERFTFGSYEVYREYSPATGKPTLERQTLIVPDGMKHLATVDTEVAPNGTAKAPLQRYQMANHLGSACLTLNENAQLLVYEEFYPYGATSFQTAASAAEASLKRYRYTGKERDEENSLYYHGARYYAPWIGRWTSCDPAGLTDSHSMYVAVSNNPIRIVDPSGHNGEPVQTWLYESKAYYQKVTATARGRGFTKAVRENLKKVYQMWGGQGAPDIAHIDKNKPFAITRAGETSEVVAQEPSVNRADAARDRATKARAKAEGKFVREGNVDPKAVKGARHEQHAAAEAFEEQKFKDWHASEAPASTSKAVPGSSTAAEATQTAHQLELPLGKSEASAASAEAHVAAESSFKQATSSGEHALASEARVGLKEGATLGGKAAKFVPFIGIAVGIGFVAHDLSQHEYGAAILDAAEAIPVVGDVVGAGHAAVVAGGALNKGLGIDEVASGHGLAVESAAKDLGLGSTSANALGATATVLSSIAVAPVIAAHATIARWLR